MLNISNFQNGYNNYPNYTKKQQSFKGASQVNTDKLKRFLKDLDLKTISKINIANEYLQDEFPRLLARTDKNHRMTAEFRFFTQEEISKINNGERLPDIMQEIPHYKKIELPENFNNRSATDIMNAPRTEIPIAQLPQDSTLGIAIKSEGSLYANPTTKFFSIEEEDGLEKLKKYVNAVINNIELRKNTAKSLK